MLYFDNAATTRMDERVLMEMLPYLQENYFNPSAFYRSAQKVRDRLEDAREVLAAQIGATSAEVFFTSGATESNNFAIKQVARDYLHKGNHIITTKVEHHSILHSVESLEREGFEVSYLSVDANGGISLEELKKTIRPDTILISVMYANNEIGNIFPIQEIGAIAKERGILFHTDAVQALGYLDLDVGKLGVDLLSVSGHKVHAPKGIGALYVKKGVKVKSLITGGVQEKKRRAGTENVAGIIGFQKAIEILEQERKSNAQKVQNLRDYLEEGLMAVIPGVVIHGNKAKRLPGISNVRIEGFRNEDILIQLDMQGICVSGGSACTTGSLEPSHVLTVLGLSKEEAMQGLRFSLSKYNTKEEVDVLIQALQKIVHRKA